MSNFPMLEKIAKKEEKKRGRIIESIFAPQAMFMRAKPSHRIAAYYQAAGDQYGEVLGSQLKGLGIGAAGGAGLGAGIGALAGKLSKRKGFGSKAGIGALIGAATGGAGLSTAMGISKARDTFPAMEKRLIASGHLDPAYADIND